MRRFRFEGNPNNYNWKVRPVKGVVYNMGQLNKMCGDWGYAIDSANDFIEVFEPLHKDTDLGYYAGLFVAALTNDPASLKLQSEIACHYRAKWAITQAKELIKQLDKEVATPLPSPEP